MAHGTSSTSTTSSTASATTAPRDRTPGAVEARWQRVWDELGVFRARDDGTAPRRYLLTMFPYPSGDLHMGHAEVFALEDVVARYWRQQGYDVLNPVGWDSFGLPAENAAIHRGEHPSVFTYANIETQARSIRRYGVSFDWTRRLHTSDPEYYRWTQWLFLRLHERGLAYRRRSAVNWCPRDQTVLANEQVVQGRCERCGTDVTRRELSQWYLRITAYADRLLDDMAGLSDSWPEPVLAMQRHWIGRSTGAHLRFAVEGRDEPVTVFTTRPDTLDDATFLVVAPDGPLAAALCAPDRRAALDAHLETVRHRSELDRTAAVGDSAGVSLGLRAVHPVDGRRLPVWAADYVLPDHGTGAVMGVPAHDERDAGFASAHGLPARGPAVCGSATRSAAAHGPAAPRPDAPCATPDPDPAPPQDVPTAVARAVAAAEAAGYGEAAVGYRLRDWLVSRQRYWGTPIPMVHCTTCGEVRVPDADLPVTLPDLRGADLTPRGVSPLAAVADWVATTCPSCGGPASRDTDTMDTFVDSSWYFLRYCSPGAADMPFDPADARRWMPAAQYVGGAEHAILHLLYSRFVTKVLHDMGLVEPVEPFASLLNQGQVGNQGRAMSKSLGNGVELGAQLDAYGVDAVRLTMVFAGPPEDDIDWADVSPAGAQRFLARALRLADDVTCPVGADPRDGDVDLRRRTHRTVRDVTALLDASRFNVVVARVMELVSAVRRAIDSGPGGGDPAVREAAEVVAVVLSLVAPYTAEEMWAALGHDPSVATAGWPVPDPALLVEATVTAVVQVQGRVRARLDVPPDIDEDELRRRALDLPEVHRALDGRPVARTVVRAPHLVNIVPGVPGGAGGPGGPGTAGTAATRG